MSGERGVVSGTPRMAVVAKPATKSADSSASVIPEKKLKLCALCALCVKKIIIKLRNNKNLTQNSQNTQNNLYIYT